jgi:16S rRNA (guanine966-N2)-methyltransferase
MRIIGGRLSGRTIAAPEGRTTRPMLDRIRQALFNIIEHHDWEGIGDPLQDALVLDAFCGTGALAFEALSRGASRATLFDKDRNALKVTKENATKLGLVDVCQIMAADTLRPPSATYKCGLVFVAPPYRKHLIAPALIALDEASWIAENALIVAETAKKEPLELPDNFVPLFSRLYADTALHFVVRN